MMASKLQEWKKVWERELVRLKGTRLSHAEIAVQMEVKFSYPFTRDMIAGKVYRMGMQQPKSVAAPKEPQTLSPAMLHLAQFDRIIRAIARRQGHAITTLREELNFVGDKKWGRET